MRTALIIRWSCGTIVDGYGTGPREDHSPGNPGSDSIPEWHSCHDGRPMALPVLHVLMRERYFFDQNILSYLCCHGRGSAKEELQRSFWNALFYPMVAYDLDADTVLNVFTWHS